MTSPRSLRWGFTFIAAGLFWLLIRMDVISAEAFLFVLVLWPLWLIAIGIEMIFKNSPLKAFGYVSPALMAVVFILAGVEAHDVEQGQRGEGRLSYRYSQKVDTDISTLNAKIELGDYDLLMRSRKDMRIRGKMTGWQRAPKIEYEVDGTQAAFQATPHSSLFSWSGRPFYHLIHINGRPLAEPEYRLDIPDDVTLRVELTGDESNAELNLAETSLQSLIADVDDVALSLVVGDKEPLIEITLSGSGNRFRLNIPGHAGVWLDGDGIGKELTGYLERFGLQKLGSAFVSPGYDTLTPQIKVTVNDDLERLSLKTY